MPKDVTLIAPRPTSRITWSQLANPEARGKMAGTTAASRARGSEQFAARPAPGKEAVVTWLARAILGFTILALVALLTAVGQRGCQTR